MAKVSKLTQHQVDALQATGKDYKVWEIQTPGFHVRVYPSGQKTYAFFYRNAVGEPRTVTISKVIEGIKLDWVRSRARELLVEVQKGGDPSEAKRATRRSSCVSELFEEYLDKHARPHKKPRSVAEDERNWRTHLSPLFGRMKIDKVTKRDLDGFMSNMSERRGAANRCMALMSTMMNLAVQWEYRGDNPCQRVKRYEENQLDNFLDRDQAVRLIEALDAEQDRGAAKAIELLLLTGARRSEVLNATWHEFVIEGDAPLWTVPREVMKGHVRKRVDLRRPLSREAAELLQSWRSEAKVTSMSWVFPSTRDPSKPRADLKDAWHRVRKAAGVPHLRLHDLRHSFASAAVNAGMSLYAVGAALGHRDVRTTQRYAHLIDQGVRATADVVGQFARRG